MTWLRDTIAGRTIVVLVLGLGSIMGLAQYLYLTGIEREVSIGNAERVAERLLLAAESLRGIEADKRDDAAHRLSGGPLEMHWGREPLATPGGSLDDAAVRLRDSLIARSPRLADAGLVLGTSRVDEVTGGDGKSVDDRHTTLLSLPIDQGSWLNVSLARVQVSRAATPSVLLSALLGAAGIVLISILMGRWLTRPLDRLALASSRLFVTSETATLPEEGTREVRTLAVAINDLQHRIRRLVNDRTHMLAAISHDLRTPLTRLRLRAESIADHGVRQSIEADLDEMAEMLDATLAFLRDDLTSEPSGPVDLAAILHTIADDVTDAGKTIELDVPRQLVVIGRHLALKRALTNLVQNSVKYGGHSSVSGSIEGEAIRITVSDEGPGIPEDKLEVVFEPFYRLESSRNRETGGHGLGLTVARTIIRGHGGELMLANLSPRGLTAIVTLPQPVTDMVTRPNQMA